MDVKHFEYYALDIFMAKMWLFILSDVKVNLIVQLNHYIKENQIIFSTLN